jgi:hypothetical protein
VWRNAVARMVQVDDGCIKAGAASSQLQGSAYDTHKQGPQKMKRTLSRMVMSSSISRGGTGGKSLRRSLGCGLPAAGQCIAHGLDQQGYMYATAWRYAVSASVQVDGCVKAGAAVGQLQGSA